MKYRQQVFNAFDLNHDGVIVRHEYITFLAIASSDSIEKKLRALFTVNDVDNDGSLDVSELETMLKTAAALDPNGGDSDEMPFEMIAELMHHQLDANGDGKLTVDEFIAVAKPGNDEGLLAQVLGPALHETGNRADGASLLSIRSLVELSIDEMQQLALAMPGNSNGEVSSDEFLRIWNSCGLDRKWLVDNITAGVSDSREYRDCVFRVFDGNKRGFLSAAEFKAFLAIQRGTESEKLAAIFKIFDTNNSGTITPDELLEIIRSLVKLDKSGVNTGVGGYDEGILTEQVSDMIFNEIDTDGDGNITFDEWMRLAEPGTEGILSGIIAAPFVDQVVGSIRSSEDGSQADFLVESRGTIGKGDNDLNALDEIYNNAEKLNNLSMASAAVESNDVAVPSFPEDKISYLPSVSPPIPNIPEANENVSLIANAAETPQWGQSGVAHKHSSVNEKPKQWGDDTFVVVTPYDPPGGLQHHITLRLGQIVQVKHQGVSGESLWYGELADGTGDDGLFPGHCVALVKTAAGEAVLAAADSTTIDRRSSNKLSREKGGTDGDSPVAARLTNLTTEPTKASHHPISPSSLDPATDAERKELVAIREKKRIAAANTPSATQNAADADARANVLNQSDNLDDFLEKFRMGASS